MNTTALEQTAHDVEQAMTEEGVASLRERLSGPLAVVAIGGSMPAANFWAQLHERTTRHPAWAISPYALLERGVPTGTRVLILSAGGGHHDVLRAARAATEAGWPATSVTCRLESPLGQWMKDAGGSFAALELAKPIAADRVLAVHSLVPLLVAAARVYGGAGPWAPCFSAPAATIGIERPRYVITLGTGLSAPAAQDFSYKCKESGLAPSWHDDPRDFAHGPFITLGNFSEDALVVALATGPQRAYLERYLACLPPSVRVVRIEVEGDGIAAGLSLFARALRTFEIIGRASEVLIDPDRIPAWGASIYQLAL